MTCSLQAMPIMYDGNRKLRRSKSRWDSSDPERAPPPLPLNPRSMSPVTRSNVSPNVQAIAAKFTGGPSENHLSSYTTNPMPPTNKSGSPERSLVKGHYHKRMQSLQPSDTTADARSEFMNYLENRSPERPLRATIVEPQPKQQDVSNGAGSPSNRPFERDIPSYVSNRYLSKPILGDANPSATMLALQNMQLPSEMDPPSPSKPPKMITATADTSGHTMSLISTQILSLTDICSSLQKEMSNLSRRSKDNATDLVSLKAATNSRDEDIRKSLKDLSSSLATKLMDGDLSRSDLSAFLKPENLPNPGEMDSSPTSKRSYSHSLPRMTSPSPFANFDRDICGSPTPITDGSASIALLEKVLREMATKDGEERLLELVDEIKTRPSPTASSKNTDKKITNMLEEILKVVKEDPLSRSLIMRSMSMDPEATVRALDIPKLSKNDEVLSILRSVKTSVIEGGGMTNGVKALVRELRGEVLGMGRNLARQLETIESIRSEDHEEKIQPPTAEEISAIVNENLEDLREQLAATIDESRQHSTALSTFQSSLNSAEIYSVVKKALDELELPQPQAETHGPVMEKEDILETVREAWETYKPEIELQNFGLERDEILDVLSEGLKSYQPQHQESLTYEEVLAAVHTGMENFNPPPIEQPPSITRDEIILTIRECLEKSEPVSRGLDEDHVNHLNTMRDDILSAVSDKLQPTPSLGEEHVTYFNSIRDEILAALAEKDESSSRGADEQNVDHMYSIRDEIMNAMHEQHESGENHLTHLTSMKDDILNALPEKLQTIPISLDETHIDIFHSIRDEILGAIAEKHGSSSRDLDEDHVRHLDSLRDEILNAVTGSMVSQSTISKESFDSGIGRDEIVSAISDGLEAHFSTTRDTQPDESRISRDDVVNAINEAFYAQNSALVPPSISREEIMNAIVDGIEIVNSNKSPETETALTTIQPSISREDILEAIAEGLERSGGSEKCLTSDVQQPSITRDEVFNAITEGIESSHTMTREIELNKDDLLEAITAGLNEAATTANLNVGDQVLERLQDVVEGMKEEFKQYSAANGRDTEQVLDAIKDGLAVVRKEVESYAGEVSGESSKLEIIDTVKEGLRLLQADMEKTITDASLSITPRGNPDTPELIDAMEREFEHLRGTISTLLVRDNAAGDKDDILDAIHALGEQHKSNPSDDQIINLIKEEFESMRERVDSRMELSVVRSEDSEVKPTSSDKDEIITALRDHFDTLREETMQHKDGSESMLSTTSELLDAFHDGIGTIRGDIQRVLEKPVDFDSSEIIEIVKGGLAELREDIDSLRGSFQEKEPDIETARGDELMLAQDSAIGGEFDALKTLISELHAKVESIESAPRTAEPPVPDEDSLKRSHLDELLVGLQEVQLAMGEASASREPPEGMARKEDLEVIETLIMETKAQIDEMVIPSPDVIATSEQIGALEAIVREAKDAIGDLSTRLEAEASTKSDISTLETLLKDVWIALEELKGKTKEDEEGEAEDTDKLLKSDLQTVEAMVFEVKTQIDELKLPDVEVLPTKDEIQALSTLVNDFRETMEASNEQTGQGFDARKTEHAGLAEKIDEAKFVVSELGDELKSKLDGSSEGLTELKQVLEGLAISAESFTTVESVKELTDLINREFERARGEENASTLDKEERDAAALVKHDETRAAIIVELGNKIDEKIEEVLAKYEDAHSALHSKLSESEERDLAHTEAVTSTKSLAEDILAHTETIAGTKAIAEEILSHAETITSTKSLAEDILTHAETITGTKAIAEEILSHAEAITSTKSLAEDIKLVIGAMGDNVTETCERISEESKALAGKVEESSTRLEEMHSDIKSHQQQSLGESERAVAATERVEAKLLEFNPQILETVQEILTLVGQHYDHSQKSAEEVRTELSALPSSLPSMFPALMPPPDESARDIGDDPVHSKLDTLLDHVKSSQIQEVLNTLLEHSKNDQLHEKLDRALEQGSESGNQIYERLDQILEHATNGSGSVNEKLDQLLSRPTQTIDPEQSVTQMMKLDEMHKDIMENSRKMNEMFATQSTLIAEDTKRKQQEAEDAAVALERRVAQREQVEAEIVDLHEEKDSLLKMLHTLQTERDDLVKHNTKLTKEVSGLETALEIRHQEMQQMEDRADSLEKRILEGVLDHARTVLLSRTNGVHAMNLKRNRSTRSSRSARSRSPSVLSTVSTMRDSRDSRSILGNGVGMALKRRTPTVLQTGPTAVQPNIGKERRILSLSNVSDHPSSGITNLKRSHSVKSNFSLRKASWAGRSSVSNKENEAFPEEDELDSEVESDAGTERRTSYAGTERKSSYAGTERKASYAETYTDSDLNAVTDSVVSDDRRTSVVSATSATSVTTDGHDAVDSSIVSSLADEDHVSDELESDLSDDDAQTAREDDEEEEESEEGTQEEEAEEGTQEETEESDGEEQTHDEDALDRHMAETASAMEEDVQKLLGSPPDEFSADMVVA
ncbi:hypothetical protein N7495_001687 [Penicillium taxi]|uniref:uncharacterized protein n=1 Tax=Penicillium taxi TaxID=168475 RepID=UPI002544DA93|nr:uncharacterized protein N7495_001687 [Penicillium taxi]KAJ5909005.1 hypothetical protein N7495_001687 [Penicillium taxi]